jgi:imidazolonepropionase
MIRKLFKNARIITPFDPGRPLAGKDQGKVTRIEKGALLCRDGIIEAIGDEKEVAAHTPGRCVDVEVDCGGRLLIPGFVDPHTHMCFARTREQEFSQRIEGMEYLEILRRGGGILSSVRAVRTASEEVLFSTTRKHALSALKFGTTTLEIKSGYGLETETELKMIRVIERLGRETPLDVIPTFLGAHAVPGEYAKAPDTYVDILIQEMMPAVSEQGIARFCDVFCEEGAFSLDQSRRILSRARDVGMGLKIHADEVHDLGGAGLAAELGCISAEHLLAANEENLRAMAEKEVIGVLLPATAYSLRKDYAPARSMVKMGLPVALATDCNPGSSYTESMPFIFGLAVLVMNLTVNEALVASTLNAAYAIGMAKEVGSLDKGKKADFLLLDGEGPAILAYHAGVSPVQEVYKGGELVYSQ